MFFRSLIGKLTALALAGMLPLGSVTAASGYIPTSRDTKTEPEKAEYTQQTFEDYTLLLETGTVRYYYREDRDIIAVEDKETGYTLKTGADLPFSGDIKDAVKALQKSGAPDEEILAAAESYADDLNTTYVGIANSLITVEYYESDKIKYISSASESGAESTLQPVNGSQTEYCFTVTFDSPELTIHVYISLGESSISYRIPFDEISGAGLSKLTAIDITPFLGASGGRMNVMNPDTMEWETVDNYRVPGYVLVPDGSGALIRFADNTSTFDPYVGDVYGKDYATETYYNFTSYDDVPVNDPVMPVFGIAQGSGQMAFVAWADSGAEYMDIIVNPDETKSTSYTWAYPRFEYNVNYYQLYDEKGNGYFTQMSQPFAYDVEMTYSFLFGDGSDGSPAADYTGMARTYREHLLETGDLTLMESEENSDIPIRLDFIMGDSESGVIGTNQVVVTTVEDVRDILNAVVGDGITNINSGLIGWQKKGESLTKPARMTFSGRIGSKSSFKKLFTDFAEQGIEISYSRDMVTINQKMVSYYNTAVKSVSNWYVSLDRTWLLPDNLPVTTFSYATPVKVAGWIQSLAKSVSSYSTGLTLTGMSNVLTSNWNRSGAVTTLTETVALYQEALAAVNQSLKLNLEKPNMYLWKYTDRYLQIPVGNSQYIYETDAVPFLQMVLHGTMEMYAPYANFSFYTQDCILRMIDYNISPSFILSNEPSWELADSFSADLYSTEFSLYEDLIQTIYGQVNGILSQVQGYEWTDRNVPELGVVVNTYRKGNETAYVIINYSGNSVTCYGTTVPAESAVVVK